MKVWLPWRRHWSGRLLAPSALLLVGLVGPATVSGRTRGSDEQARTLAANLWVDANGGSCARQPRRAAYGDARACGTLQAASNAAATGDLVLIRDGRYGGQLLTGTKKLTFRGAGPGRPSFGQLITSASNVTLQHLLIENRDAPTQTVCSYFDFTLFTCGARQTYDDVIVDGLQKGVGSPDRRGGLQVDEASSNLVFTNGEIRGVRDHKGFQGGAAGMMIQNTYFHDIRLTPAGEAAGVHNECAYVTGGDRQTWSGNRFVLCPVMAMFFANYVGGPPFTSVTIENNLFTHSLSGAGTWHDGSSFVIPNGAGGQNQVNNWVVRYNTFEVPPDFGRTPGTGDDNGSALFYGNLGADGACGAPEWTYRYNVGETCRGTGEVSVAGATNSSRRPNQAPFYRDAPNGDFKLRAGSAAVNRGDPDNYPARDRDGKNRLVGSAPDAGAFERVANATTGILAVGDVGGRVGSGIRGYESSNPASLLVTLGNNDPTRGRAFSGAWRGTFGWLRAAGVGVAGALGPRDVGVGRGRYQFAVLRMPGPYYVKRVGDVELLVLDSTAVTPAQTRWLRRTLARKTPRFRIAVVSHPPFACGATLGSAAVRTQWVPLLERYGVGLVLSGNDRSYQRFARAGVTYVVQPGASAQMSAPRSCPSSYPTRVAGKAARGFVYVTVDAAGVLVRVLGVNGATVDRFRIR